MHVAKHIGSAKPNVQQSPPSHIMSWVSFKLQTYHSDTTTIVVRPKPVGISLCYNW